MQAWLAQVSRTDDMIFRGLLIPMGLFIAAIGWRAIQNRQLNFRRRGEPLRGQAAVIAGVVVVVIGLGSSIAALISFL
ncbi:hypothetical protein [Planctomicrobium piriforme]|uniref:Uncharacterized protein n=1 Tax=Planctomicrobium piriforme TaxID=1576369 RepID=A0A1I3ARS6_9PLAN|nr:hypothetical protein [Planctomicrobium piriforme]SFH52439.1 hypothetical protein SAMN05421753_10111 [Planctomicrobium piriforme]